VRDDKSDTLDVQGVVKKWLTSIVIDLNLCPFAKREYLNERVRFQVSSAKTEREIVRDLILELSLLNKRDDVETTLLILPKALSEFEGFNSFLGFADSLLQEMSFEGVFQLASFHPAYQFADTQVGDAENFTNRSPYPILHILRESSLESAIKQHPDTDLIPRDNINLMNSLGSEHMSRLLRACSLTDD